MSLNDSTAEDAARTTKLASLGLAVLSETERNAGLTAMHDGLLREKNLILEANRKDMALGNEVAEAGKLSPNLVKRLDLSRAGKFDDMLKGILQVRDLPDPLGHVSSRTLLDDGLELERRSCPIGTLLVIFEARPEVIANIASLAIKSGNAAILKGGKESTESFRAIAQVISRALATTMVPVPAIQLVTSRAEIRPLLQCDKFIDLVIPRGGNELVRSIKQSTQIPVLGHADGICSIYMREDCDVEMATSVIVDSKCSYTAACNAVETLLVDAAVLASKFSTVARALLDNKVALRCDGLVKQALESTLGENELIQSASEEDFDTEFLELKLAIRAVPTRRDWKDEVDFAVDHINRHSSHHTDVILTSQKDAAEHFLQGVDSAGVYWNASTRFADGQRYGFGTEVGISTNKIHARGPVGLEGLTIYKWLIRGSGQITAEYGEGKAKQFKHEKRQLVEVSAEEMELLRRYRAEHNGAPYGG